MCAQRQPPKPEDGTPAAGTRADGASGATLRDEVLRVLLAAFEGDRAVLDRQMREEMQKQNAKMEKLEQQNEEMQSQNAELKSDLGMIKASRRGCF